MSPQCPSSGFGASRRAGAAGHKAGQEGGPGTCFVDSSEEQRGHAKEVMAESRAGTMWRRDEVTEQEKRQPGTEAAAGDASSKLQCSPACAWGPWSAAAAAPLARSMDGSAPWELGGKAGSTWVLLPLD